MFEHLAENTGEGGDRSVACSQCFITFFEDGGNLGATPLCWVFTCVDRTLKDNLNYWRNFFTQFLQ